MDEATRAGRGGHRLHPPGLARGRRHHWPGPAAPASIIRSPQHQQDHGARAGGWAIMAVVDRRTRLEPDRLTRRAVARTFTRSCRPARGRVPARGPAPGRAATAAACVRPATGRPRPASHDDEDGQPLRDPGVGERVGPLAHGQQGEPEDRDPVDGAPGPVDAGPEVAQHRVGNRGPGPQVATQPGRRGRGRPPMWPVPPARRPRGGGGRCRTRPPRVGRACRTSSPIAAGTR